MKKQLREELETLVLKLSNRIDVLETNIKEYKKEDNFESAMKCQIKATSFRLVMNQINELLKN